MSPTNLESFVGLTPGRVELALDSHFKAGDEHTTIRMTAHITLPHPVLVTWARLHMEQQSQSKDIGQAGELLEGWFGKQLALTGIELYRF